MKVQKYFLRENMYAASLSQKKSKCEFICCLSRKERGSFNLIKKCNHNFAFFSPEELYIEKNVRKFYHEPRIVNCRALELSVFLQPEWFSRTHPNTVPAAIHSHRQAECSAIPSVLSRIEPAFRNLTCSWGQSLGLWAVFQSAFAGCRDTLWKTSSSQRAAHCIQARSSR